MAVEDARQKIGGIVPPDGALFADAGMLLSTKRSICASLYFGFFKNPKSSSMRQLPAPLPMPDTVASR